MPSAILLLRCSHCDGVRHCSQVLHQFRVAGPIDIVNRITERTARIEHLPLDVDIPVAKNVVDRTRFLARFDGCASAGDEQNC